ncbi:MAG: Ribonuclease HII, partial [Candidatus Anoxychlamydiales bacterium]|nr:Ribonuclease HII [Candidatus Anoxychlamydiales bacterium]
MAKIKPKISTKERYRINKLRKIEKDLKDQGYKCIAGVDEVGIGPLAGPVVAAACILPDRFLIKGVNDSKKVSPDVRERIYNELTSNKDVIFSIGIVEVKIIDQINIHQASLLAMKQAIQNLKTKPDYLLFDGRKHPILPIPSQAIVKGDALCVSISCASIIAKVTRDRIMQDYHQKYPLYGFDLHKGYATHKHRKSLIEHGPSPIHRKSYDPV